MKNGVHLITYADSLGRNITELHSFLKNHLADALVGVHLLPFFPSSADRGFAPITYRKVEPAFGTWQDVEALGADFELTVDFMVNHVSALSEWFQDWKEKGSSSEWEDLFIPVDRLYPDGVPAEDRDRIYTRKPRDPWIPVSFDDGSVRNTWCTFSEEQIDINAFSEVGRRWMEDEIGSICAHPGIATLRLDAAGYVTKKPGTRFFFEEPEITELFDRCRTVADANAVTLLPEVHEHHSYQRMLSGWDMPVYDFALPMLLLFASFFENAEPLASWLSDRPNNCVTTLDTHDGIGVVDVADLMSQEQIDATVDALYKKGSSVNRRYSSSSYGNLDIYQINCTYFSALGEDDEAYLCSRAVQFFAPGIPQVYYVGMLAGANDINLVERTRQGRDINRHGYSIEEAVGELDRPVVRRLLKLMSFRNTCPVFDSETAEIETGKDGRVLEIRRCHGEDTAVLKVDFHRKTAEITTKGPAGSEHFRI